MHFLSIEIKGFTIRLHDNCPQVLQRTDTGGHSLNFSLFSYGCALFSVCFAAVAATIWGKLEGDIKEPKEEKEKVDREGLFLF